MIVFQRAPRRRLVDSGDFRFRHGGERAGAGASAAPGAPLCPGGTTSERIPTLKRELQTVWPRYSASRPDLYPGAVGCREEKMSRSVVADVINPETLSPAFCRKRLFAPAFWAFRPVFGQLRFVSRAGFCNGG